MKPIIGALQVLRGVQLIVAATILEVPRRVSSRCQPSATCSQREISAQQTLQRSDNPTQGSRTIRKRQENLPQ